MLENLKAIQINRNEAATKTLRIARRMALADARIAPLVAGKQIVKTVVVPKKLVNVVSGS